MNGQHHPVSGAFYELMEDGRVRVTDGPLEGYFDAEGRWLAGELEEADLHMVIATALPPVRLART